MKNRTKIADVFEAEVRNGEAKGVSKIYASLMKGHAEMEAAHDTFYSKSFSRPSSRYEEPPKPSKAIFSKTVDGDEFFTTGSVANYALHIKPKQQRENMTCLIIPHYFLSRKNGLDPNAKRVCTYEMQVRGTFGQPGETPTQVNLGIMALGVVEKPSGNSPSGYVIDTALSTFVDEDQAKNRKEMDEFKAKVFENLEKSGMNLVTSSDPIFCRDVTGMTTINAMLSGRSITHDMRRNNWVETNEEGMAKILSDLLNNDQGDIASEIDATLNELANRLSELASADEKVRKEAEAQLEAELRQVERENAYGEAWGSW